MEDLNLGDDFAVEFSRLLSNDEQLPDLEIINLKTNDRITQHGLKYLYTSCIGRVLRNRKFDMHFNEHENVKETE